MKDQTEKYLKMRVAKIFEDGELYCGTVANYDEELGWWKVVFDDGDVEDAVKLYNDSVVIA